MEDVVMMIGQLGRLVVCLGLPERAKTVII